MQSGRDTRLFQFTWEFFFFQENIGRPLPTPRGSDRTAERRSVNQLVARRADGRFLREAHCRQKSPDSKNRRLEEPLAPRRFAKGKGEGGSHLNTKGKKKSKGEKGERTGLSKSRRGVEQTTSLHSRKTESGWYRRRRTERGSIPETRHLSEAVGCSGLVFGCK